MKKDIMNIYKEEEIYLYDIDEMIYNGFAGEGEWIRIFISL